MVINRLSVLFLGFMMGFSPVHTTSVVVSGRFGMLQDVSGSAVYGHGPKTAVGRLLVILGPAIFNGSGGRLLHQRLSVHRAQAFRSVLCPRTRNAAGALHTGNSGRRRAVCAARTAPCCASSPQNHVTDCDV